MNKKKNRIIKGAMCLTMMSSLVVGTANTFNAYAKNDYSYQIVGTSRQGAFDADSLTLQPGETTTSINVNWYAPVGTTQAKIQFGDKVFDVTPTDLTTPTEVKAEKYTDTGKKVCKTTIDGLQADTNYTYYVSNDGGNTWSNEYHYTTPKADELTFGFSSDPQIKESGESNSGGWNPSDNTNQTGWEVMVNKLAQENVDLIVSAGDQVEDQSWGKSSEYEAFFAPEEMAYIPYAPAVGNHDRHYMFADHFNLPNQMTNLEEVKTTFRGQNSGTSLSHGNYTQATQTEIANNSTTNGVSPNSEGQYDYVERREMETNGNYYYLQNNVLFVTLNTGAYPGGNDEENKDNPSVPSASKDNSEAEAIVNNFKTTLASATNKYQNQYQWIVVTHHKSTQTVAKHAADSDIENYVDAGFESLMDEFNVDFVLGGHDHVYSRSYVLKDGKRNSEKLDSINDADGTIYITGNCCSDMQYYTPFEKVDKTNNADYPVLANGQTGSDAYMAGNLPIGNQEWNQEYSPSYALFNVKGNTISVNVYNLDDSSSNPTSKEIDSFKVTKNSDGGQKTKGFENDTALLAAEQTARYDFGMQNADGGVMEIVDYNTATGWAYAINGQTGNLTAIALKDLETKDNVDMLDGNDIDIKSIIEEHEKGFVYGDMTSVAVSHDGRLLALAIQAKDTNINGRNAVFACQNDGTLTLQEVYEAGVQPDNIVFTNDDKKILTANEGEPREGYDGAQDPKGSITVVDLTNSHVSNLDFSEFDNKREELINKGVVIKKGTNPSVDFEPEYIAVSDTNAYITLQEANAIAVLDLQTNMIKDIYSAGFEDYSTTMVDIDKKNETYAPKTYAGLKGIRMPDSIAAYTVDGIDYIITANEGDSREWNNYLNEVEINFGKGKSSPAGNITPENSGLSGKVVFFDTSDYDGVDAKNDYLFGGRSSTIFKVDNESVQEVSSTGADFETLTAKYVPEHFNCSNDDITIDDRSGKKGPEAESVTIGKIGDKTFSFIGLERTGGVMIYDITDPNNAKFVNYINSRDYSADIAGDDSPEGLHFISSEDSKTGKPQLLVAYEVSGTVGTYDLVLQENNVNDDTNVAPDDTNTDNNNSDGTTPGTDVNDSNNVNQNDKKPVTATDNTNKTNTSKVKTGDTMEYYGYAIALIASALVLFKSPSILKRIKND